MSSQLVKLNAFKQTLISFVLKLRQKEHRLLSSFVAVRIPPIPKAKQANNKVFESRRRRSVNSCVGHIVQIAAFIGLPVVYNAPASSSSFPSPHSRYQMAEESSLESVLQNADQLFDENHFQEVVDVLDKYKDQNLPEIQWRKARATFSVSKATKDKSEKEKLIKNAHELIKTAVAADPGNFAAHKWMAIIMDAAAELQGIKARILELDNIKFHMNEAVRLNPEDPTSWHMIGAYEYGLAELSWIQRKLVSTIFASPPTGSFEKALENFEKAEKLKEGFYSTNWLMIGKCHIALKQNDKAKGFLEKAANCAVLNEDDKKCKEEAVALLRKL
ncbi:regulator of microtubule dynamics protein 1-like isoform X1 [Episyrphus balteatus]|uniref:regulator of microtubule dynamics protein 1-like isoform X1 n=2 Tax=Episyrphus balteatus TaxID=286459 RepID=UPI0024855663|nr:regulator of microtubule dynamics protein 1-like isoform X1 [Episyrphus balteatus]